MSKKNSRAALALSRRITLTVIDFLTRTPTPVLNSKDPAHPSHQIYNKCGLKNASITWAPLFIQDGISAFPPPFVLGFSTTIPASQEGEEERRSSACVSGAFERHCSDAALPVKSPNMCSAEASRASVDFSEPKLFFSCSSGAFRGLWTRRGKAPAAAAAAAAASPPHSPC